MKIFEIVNKIWNIIVKIFPKKSLISLKNIYYNLRYLFYIGNTYFCPICGLHFRKFLPYGKGENIACPKDDSVVRHRLIWLFLKFKTNFFSENLKVLHISPSYSLQRNFNKLNSLIYITIDLNSPLTMFKMDITDLKFKNDFFDVIICSHVLEHVKNDRQAIKELFRVLKPEGWTLILCPINFELKETYENFNIIDPNKREIIFGQKDHVRIYGFDFIDRLESSGFIVNVDNYVMSFGSKVNNKYRLQRNEKIFFCFKPEMNSHTKT